MATARTPRRPASIKGNRAGIAMPSSLPASMQGEFDELIDHLASRRDGLVPIEDLALVENLLFHRATLRQMFEDVRANGPVVDGKHNPSASGMPTHSGSVVKLAAALSLGPAARARMKAPAVAEKKPAESSPWGDGQ